MENRKNVLKIIVALFAIGVVFYLLTFLTPLYASDFNFALRPFDISQRIANLYDIYNFNYAVWHVLHGRIWSNTLTNLFMLCNKQIFNVVNTSVFLSLILLVCYHSRNTLKGLKSVHIVLAAGILFIFTPAFGQDYLWLCGSANYLFCFVPALLFLIPFISDYKTITSYNWAEKIIFCLCGFIAGNTVENCLLALVVMIALSMILRFYNNEKINSLLFVLIVCFCISTVFSLSAPGLQNRAGMNSDGILIVKALHNCSHITKDMIVNYWILLVLLFSLFFNKKEKQNFKQYLVDLEKRSLLIYIVGFIVTLYCLIPVSFPIRAYGFSTVLLAIIVMKGANEILPKLKYVTTVATVVLLAFALEASSDLRATHKEDIKRQTYIRQRVAQGDKVISIPALKSRTKYNTIPREGDIDFVDSVFPNYAIAGYYGIDRIIRVDSITPMNISLNELYKDQNIQKIKEGFIGEN